MGIQQWFNQQQPIQPLIGVYKGPFFDIYLESESPWMSEGWERLFVTLTPSFASRCMVEQNITWHIWNVDASPTEKNERTWKNKIWGVYLMKQIH